MIRLGDLEADALGELFNLGVGRAADALSQILGSTIALSSPLVELMSLSQARAALTPDSERPLSQVSQSFRGPFRAEGILIFPESNALLIVTHLLGGQLQPDELAEYEQEVMCEVGNIILNACISILADSFGISFDGGLPQHQYGSVESLCQESSESEPAVLVLHVQMLVKEHNIDGRLLYLLSVESLQQLFEHLDRYLVRQGLK